MANEFLHFLLRLVLALLNAVLDYLIQPLPKWQTRLVWVAAFVSTSSALVLLAGGTGRQSLIAFFLVFIVSRPIPPKHRWAWPIVVGCLTLIVGSAPYTWLQVHGIV